MAKCIADKIIEEARVGVERGQAKYRQYFIKYTWYKDYKTAVDNRLIAAGYGACIVTE